MFPKLPKALQHAPPSKRLRLNNLVRDTSSSGAGDVFYVGGWEAENPKKFPVRPAPVLNIDTFGLPIVPNVTVNINITTVWIRLARRPPDVDLQFQPPFTAPQVAPYIWDGERSFLPPQRRLMRSEADLFSLPFAPSLGWQPEGPFRAPVRPVKVDQREVIFISLLATYAFAPDQAFVPPRKIFKPVSEDLPMAFAPPVAFTIYAFAPDPVYLVPRKAVKPINENVVMSFAIPAQAPQGWEANQKNPPRYRPPPTQAVEPLIRYVAITPQGWDEVRRPLFLPKRPPAGRESDLYFQVFVTPQGWWESPRLLPPRPKLAIQPSDVLFPVQPFVAIGWQVEDRKQLFIRRARPVESELQRTIPPPPPAPPLGWMPEPKFFVAWVFKKPYNSGDIFTGIIPQPPPLVEDELDFHFTQFDILNFTFSQGDDLRYTFGQEDTLDF